MFDPKVLLDALVGASARPDNTPTGGAPTGKVPSGKVPSGKATPQGASSGSPLDQALGSLTGGGSAGDLLQKAKDVMAQNPALAQAAVMGLAGLLMGKRKSGGGGIPGSLAKLGGLAVIGTLAYKAFQARQQGAAASDAPTLASGLAIPQDSRFHPVKQTEDDAILYLKAMVAAAAADGHVDEGERARIARGLGEAGIDQQATRWLEEQFAAPADVDELSANVNSQEKAAQVYAAARIAIEPDTIQEREFLRQLAEALDLDAAVKQQVDQAASRLKA